MNQKRILVIDDSSTIRRLVDSHLSQLGYHVVLAPNAEEGLEQAAKVRPDLILLDHQLPGTTGFQVCRQLATMPELRHIPVVVTSTLRKKAYAEYTEMPNVVDSLPKPFTPELLATTIANALETASIVVQSQADGTAMPEVIHELAETALSGTFRQFGMREIVDFLNNGCRAGALEVEVERDRIWFYIAQGRIQAVVGASVDPREVAATLPDTLQDLASVLDFTVGGRFCSQVDSLVQLLDRKVLDPRMLRGLLRHQAAMLTRRCFTRTLNAFRFAANTDVPALFRKLPLDVSLASLLVEGALVCAENELPAESAQTTYVRRSNRGQNLDRAGLSAQHMKLLGCLDEPVTADALAQKLAIDPGEVRRVLHGLVLAEWVQTLAPSQARTVIALEPDPVGSQQLRELFAREPDRFVGKVVRDRLGLQLVLKRSQPSVLLLALDSLEHVKLARELRNAKQFVDTKFLGILPPTSPAVSDCEKEAMLLGLDAVLRRPYTEEQATGVLTRLFEESSTMVTATMS